MIKLPRFIKLIITNVRPVKIIILLDIKKVAVLALTMINVYVIGNAYLMKNVKMENV